MPMETVDLLFDDPEHRTAVWVSERVQGIIDKYRRKHRQRATEYFHDIQYYAENGFKVFVGGGRPIQHKRSGVYATEPRATLFRLYGFQRNDWNEFIVLGATLKDGQKMKNDDWDEVNHVIRVRNSKRGWKKRETL